MRSRPSPVPVVLALAETARATLPTLVDGALGRAARERCDRRLERWSRRAIRHAGMNVEIAGTEHIDPEETYVVMSNHQSNVDIFVVFQAFPGTLRMVAKAEMKEIPILGKAMETAEFIFVDRRGGRDARAAIIQAGETIRSGISVWIAPEGTRSVGGSLGTFKKGGFILALQSGVRILPCTLNGTFAVMPKGSALMRRGQQVSVLFHPPVDPSRFGMRGRNDLVAHVRAQIAGALPPERASVALG